jgi:CPA2 family monovalent cation:H+ antiporter-2
MTDLLLLIFLFLAAGVVAVPIASRLGLGSVLGYLSAGMVISPLLSVLNVQVESIQHVAEFGVVMMLFLVGLELEPKLLWSMRHRLLGLGGLQVGLTCALVMLGFIALGYTWQVSLAVGLVFSLSSTAIVLQTLNEKGLFKSQGGQASFSVLLFQDIAVIPMLALLPLLASTELLSLASTVSNESSASNPSSDMADHASSLSLVAGLPGWAAGLVTAAAVAAVVLVGSRLTRPVFRFIAMANLRELFTATALGMVVGIALLMSLVGLSPALGTFLAGVVLANSEYRHELESHIYPFKGLLLGLFFMTVGAGINFELFLFDTGTVLGLTLGLIAIKALVLWVLSVVFGINGTDRWLVTLGLAQAGEFGFVLLTFTVGQAIIPQVLADQLLLVVALSMLLTPAIFIVFERVIAPRLTGAQQQRPSDTIAHQSDIIIAGHGRVGGIVNRMLGSAQYNTTVIDFSSKQLEVLRTFGFQAYFGDATRPDLLAAAGIAQAKVLVIAIDGREQITALAQYVGHNWPHVHVVARAMDRTHVYELWATGCRDVIRETYDSSLRMGRSTLEAMGLDTAQATHLRNQFEQADRNGMLELAEVYKPGVPAHDNPEYVATAKQITDSMRVSMQRQGVDDPG